MEVKWNGTNVVIYNATDATMASLHEEKKSKNWILIRRRTHHWVGMKRIMLSLIGFYVSKGWVNNFLNNTATTLSSTEVLKNPNAGTSNKSQSLPLQDCIHQICCKKSSSWENGIICVIQFNVFVLQEYE